MLGKPAQPEMPLYMPLDFERLIPADHPLRRIDRVLDLSFVRREVAHLYGTEGNPSVDPEVLMRMMLLLVIENIASERKLALLMPARLDWRWFCRLDLLGDVPHHSVLSKARARWGIDLFESLFDRVLEQCRRAGLVGEDVFHIDSTLIRADASLEGRVSRRLFEQLEQAARDAQDDGRAEGDRHGSATGGQDTRASRLPARPEGKVNRMLASPVDPDAATVTRPTFPRALAYRDHRLVDDRRGIVVATEVMSGDVDDAWMLKPLLTKAQFRGGLIPSTVVGDGMYGTRANFDELAERGIDAVLKRRRGKQSPKIHWTACLDPKITVREAKRLMRRRRTVQEGGFAQAKEQHGHRRMRWRRRWRCQIQALLVATVQNLKRAARAPARGIGTAAAAASSAMAAAIYRVTIRAAAAHPILGADAPALRPGTLQPTHTPG